MSPKTQNSSANGREKRRKGWREKGGQGGGGERVSDGEPEKETERSISEST